MSRIPINDENSQQQPEADEPQPTPPEAQSLQEQVKKLQEERDTLFERLARTTADFKNMQKRLHADKEQAVQYANSQLIKSLLVVIDNFERALAVDASKADAASILRGMQIVHDQWMNVLGTQDVEVIAPEPGTPFDPNHHQALMQQADERFPGSEPTVTQLLQKGYMLHGRVLRPASVAVSKTS